jgi:hypothetical protein
MPLQPVTCANFCRALSCCAGVRPNPMSGYFKIPEYLIPTLLDKRGEVVKDADGKPKKDVRGLEKLIVLFFEANRAHIIGRDEANLLTIPGHPCAISDGTREIRSNRGVFVLRAIRRIRLTSARSLSSRMSPRHPQSGGDFRRGAYHDLLDAGGNPAVLAMWGKEDPVQRPHCDKCKEPLERDKNGTSLCRACAEKADFDSDVIEIIRDLSREPVNESAA